MFCLVLAHFRDLGFGRSCAGFCIRCWSCLSFLSRYRCNGGCRCWCAGLCKDRQCQCGEQGCNDDGFRFHGKFLKRCFSVSAFCFALLPLTNGRQRGRHQSVSKYAIVVSDCCRRISTSNTSLEAAIYSLWSTAINKDGENCLRAEIAR